MWPSTLTQARVFVARSKGESYLGNVSLAFEIPSPICSPQYLYLTSIFGYLLVLGGRPSIHFTYS